MFKKSNVISYKICLVKGEVIEYTQTPKSDETIDTTDMEDAVEVISAGGGDP